MLDKETKLRLEKFIDKINVVDSRVYSMKIAFDDHFIYLQFEVIGEGVQQVLRINDFICGKYSMMNVYAEISDAILEIIEREYSIRLERLLRDE